MKEIIIAMSIPSVLISFSVWMLQRKIEKSQKKSEEREREREIYNRMMLRTLNACVSLCEANAIALKNGKTNGETEKALEYVRKVKHEQRDFFEDTVIQKVIN